MYPNKHQHTGGHANTVAGAIVITDHRTMGVQIPCVSGTDRLNGIQVNLKFVNSNSHLELAHAILAHRKHVLRWCAKENGCKLLRRVHEKM